MKTYGTVKYDKRAEQWLITCEPHVAIRLKRIFGKADKREFGTIKLSATPENSRDLEWFLERYPMDLTDRVLLTDLSGEFKEKTALIDQLLAGRVASRAFDLKLPLRDYQQFASDMWLTAQGLLLADDVGLGKTAVAIAGLTDPRLRPALIVVPTHLQTQWIEQVHKFTDGMVCHKLTKGRTYDLTKACKGKFPDIIVSTYFKLDGWAGFIERLIHTVIFDECQELRHQGSAKYNAAKKIARDCQWRLGLSATPIYNYGGEIYNVLDVLQPEVLGSWEEFSREWCGYKYGKPTIENPKAFGVYAREAGLMLRRTRIEVRRELPDITVVPHEIDADTNVLERMQGQAIELAKTILKQNQSFKGEIMQAAGEFDMRMRQATGIAKAPFVADFVRFLVENDDEKIVLFGWHREVYNIWMERLRDLKPVMYTGSETPAEKEKAKKAFIEGDSKVMIISLRSGAGLDGLQDVAHIVVFGELDWSPGVHEQCVGRVHRDGQGEPVIVYYLVSESGSDPIVQDVLGLKKQQIEGLRDPNQDLVTKLQIQQDYIKKLAAKYLADRGIAVPQETPVEAA